MKELFNILDQKERRIIGLCCLLLLAAFFFLLFGAVGEKRIYIKTLNTISEKEENHHRLSQEKEQKKEEWLKWQNAGRDIQEIKAKYFYKDNDVFQQVRSDLREIFHQAGIHVSQIIYDYAEHESEKVKKVIVSFNLKGSYFSLKRFLNVVEQFPKFLILEKINFLNIEAQGGVLELRIILAGYYES
ncbi:MAG: hypothetical protein ACLFVG_01755 [Candidatus Aminicenantes bacterium]